MKLLLFDIDGTLLKPAGFGKKAFLRAFEETCGVLPEGDFAYDGMLDSEIAAKSLELAGIGPDEALSRKLLDVYVSLLPSEVPEDPSKWLCPNVPNILSEAAGKDCKLAVVTGNVREAAVIKLNAANLSGFFPAGAYGSDAGRRWELIPLAMARAGIHYRRDFSREETLMVGDSVRDIEAAKTAGVRSISVATGLATYSSLARENPDFLLQDLSSESFWGLPI